MFLSVSNTKPGLVKQINFISTDGKQEYISFDQSSLPIPYHSDNVIIIDISNLIPKDFDIRLVMFVTQNIPNSTLNIMINDKERSCNRPLESNKMLFSRDKISIQMKEQSIQASYSIQIRYFSLDSK